MVTFFKVVVLGDGGIGKTSICNYLTTGEFFGSYKLSIGADFFSKRLVVDGEEVTLQICDIGGQDQFAEISNIFTKGAHGCILCYDTTRRDTLDSLDRWLGKLEDNSIPKVLVSTKNDVEDLREVLDEEGIETAKRLDISFYIPTTSLKGIGITETFEAISTLMLLHKKGMDLPQLIENNPKVDRFEFPTFRPLHLRECFVHKKMLKISDTNRFVPITRHLNINKEIKRQWFDKFENVGDMLSGRIIKSKAWEIKTARELSREAEKKLRKELEAEDREWEK